MVLPAAVRYGQAIAVRGARSPDRIATPAPTDRRPYDDRTGLTQDQQCAALSSVRSRRRRAALMGREWPGTGEPRRNLAAFGTQTADTATTVSRTAGAGLMTTHRMSRP